MSDRDTAVDDSALACPIPSHLRCTGVGKSRRWTVRLSGDAPYSYLIWINVRITALRKLAVEAADNGLLAPELAAGITRIKGVKSKGARVGNWLSIRQAQTLLNTPDVSTKKGLRDRPMLAVLLGCGLHACRASRAPSDFQKERCRT